MVDTVDISKAIKAPCQYLKSWSVATGSAMRVRITADIQSRIETMALKVVNADGG